MSLEALGGNGRILVNRQKSSVIRKSSDGSVVCRGEISSVEEVEEGAKNAALGDT